MDAKRNYQKELDKLISGLGDRRPTLLLHACCAPCSSYVLEYLSRYFEITLYFYNPNIAPVEEYRYRCGELKRLVAEMLPQSGIRVLEAPYDARPFYEAARGLEGEPEGGARCMKCYRLRLEATAQMAREQGFEYFTTTLSISPLKNAAALNAIGEELGPFYDTKYLTSDFKKREGYKRSIQLSAQYGLYRQDYCGCAYSKAQRERQKAGQSE